MNKAKKKKINDLFSEGKISKALDLTNSKDLNFLSSVAESFFYKKEFLKSLQILNKIINWDPLNKNALYNKAQVLLKLGKIENAIEAYDKVIEIDPEDADVWYDKGNALFCLKKFEEAIKTYNKGIKINPKIESQFINKGAALIELGKFQEAIKTYNKGIKINPKNELVWYNLANALIKWEKFEDAVEIINKAIQINPKNERLWNVKGVGLANFGKFEEAIKTYNKAIEINPQYADAWYNKGNALSNFGKFDDSIKCYNKAIKINPQDENALYNKGVSLADLGKYKEAIKTYNKAIKINREKKGAWGNKGIALVEIGEFEKGIEAYDKVIEIDPEDTKAWCNKGNALFYLKKFEEAIKAFDKAIEINPKKEMYLTNKGAALIELGKFEEAIKTYNKVIEINPKNGFAWYNKGIALANFGKFEEAIKTYNEAIKINPQDEKSWSEKGKTLAKIKKIDEALKSFGHAYVVNKGFKLTDDYSLGSAKPVTHKESQIISHILSDINKDWIKIALVQLNYSLKLNEASNHFGYKLVNKKNTRTRIFNALDMAKKEKIDLICFPELCTKKDWVEEAKTKYDDMLIIFGSYYHEGFNICPIIINGTVYNYQKVNPSPNFETEIIANRGMKKGRNIFHFQTNYGSIVVLNCMDYLKEIHQTLTHLEKQDIAVDLVIVPQYNRSAKRFQEHSNYMCQEYGCPYIIHVNAEDVLEEKVGGTSIIGLEHKSALQSYEMRKIKPKDNVEFKFFEITDEVMVVFELDLKNRSKILPARGPKIRGFKRIPID